MTRGAARAGRFLALVLAATTAALGLLLLPTPTSTLAAPTQDCSTTTLLEKCPTTTDRILITTTTAEQITTSTARATTTTARQTTTTTEQSSQEPTTTLAPGAGANILIPGDGTEGAESTTTTVVPMTRVGAGGLDDGTLIALVIIGLVLIAGVAAVLTRRYLVATRPQLRDTDTGSAPAG